MDYRLRQNAEEKLQGEIGTIYKSRHSESIAVALAYPNSYYVGMSNLGILAIYGFLNERSGVCCERVFLPDKEVFDLYAQTGASLCSLESQTPVAEFDILAFSVSFENDYLNILTMLELAKVPLKAEERDERFPLVVVGGAISAINPEPLAMFVDVFVLGDGEPVLDELLDLYRQHSEICSRPEFLECLAVLPGLYVPALYDISYSQNGQIRQLRPLSAKVSAGIGKCSIDSLDRHPAYSRILTEHTEFGKLFLLQINRGCCYKCRFCHTGYTQNPLRHLTLDVALALVCQGLRHRQRIGLVGAAIADYPHLEDLCAAISAQGGSISVSSLRLSAFSQATYLLEMLVAAGQKTITMAPEAGTERLRRIIRKPLSDEAFYETVTEVLEAQVPNLKLYFLIGLPSETWEDVEAIVAICIQCRQLMVQAARARGTIGKLIVSVNPFVPKPFTPLQWCAMDSEAELKRKLQFLKRALQRLGNVELIHEAPRWAIWQGILARGDRKLGDVLLKTLQYQGNWKKAFRELEMSPEFYVHRTRSIDERLPWSHFQIGTSQQHLADEYQSLFPAEAS
ncbi:MAG: radical SAM protein [bacterium]|nr:radical SAM protein [bacterium]